LRDFSLCAAFALTFAIYQAFRNSDTANPQVFRWPGKQVVRDIDFNIDVLVVWRSVRRMDRIGEKFGHTDSLKGQFQMVPIQFTGDQYSIEPVRLTLNRFSSLPELRIGLGRKQFDGIR
jgi:hypothetical protein